MFCEELDNALRFMIVLFQFIAIIKIHSLVYFFNLAKGGETIPFRENRDNVKVPPHMQNNNNNNNINNKNNKNNNQMLVQKPTPPIIIGAPLGTPKL
jgi:hypothetical protein